MFFINSNISPAAENEGGEWKPRVGESYAYLEGNSAGWQEGLPDPFHYSPA